MSDFIGRSRASKLKNETIANGTNKKLPDIRFISTNMFFRYAGKPHRRFKRNNDLNTAIMNFWNFKFSHIVFEIRELTIEI